MCSLSRKSTVCGPMRSTVILCMGVGFIVKKYLLNIPFLVSGEQIQR
jgi:hypothetical protein